MKKVFFFPMVIQIITVIVLVYGLFATDSIYKSRIIPFAIILLAIWLICLYKSKPLNPEFVKDKNQARKNTGFIIISLVISLFFACTIWNKGYLSLAPIARINLGIPNQDTLFHSSIAESFNRSIFPSTLANDEVTLPYHTFSHFLMYLISGIVSVPCFIGYNYIYPIVFIPLYIFVQLYAIISAKECFSSSKELSMMDLLFVVFFNCGMFGNSILSSCGIWKASNIISESFLVGNILVFFFYAVFMKAVKNREKLNIVYKRFLLFAVIPMSIFLISWSKISLGYLFTISILYYFFRTRLKQMRYWLLNGFYILEFYICMKLFMTGIGAVTTGIGGQFQLLAFGRVYCEGIWGFLGHYILLSLMGIIFVLFEIKNNKYTLPDFLQGKTIWIEEVVLLSVAAFAPGLILNIAGGSAAYFSYFTEIPAMILLCGKSYIRNVLDDRKSLKDDLTQKDKRKYMLSAGIFIWSICIGFANSVDILCSGELIPDDNGAGFYDELMEIREMAGDSPDKYTIYLEPDAKVTRIFTNPLSQIYIYPSLTRIGVINASYVQDGLYYDFHDAPIKDYGLTRVQHGKLSFDTALERARDLGKEKVIHMMKDAYEVVDCR